MIERLYVHVFVGQVKLHFIFEFKMLTANIVSLMFDSEKMNVTYYY